jgi:large subunit ribosomal protein L21
MLPEELPMYAVIQTGGKQYRVQEGDTVEVEKLALEPGSPVQFDEVLLVADGENVQVGRPRVAGAQVSGEVVAEELGEKIVIFKYKRRKGYRRKQGHRQVHTTVKITAIRA